MKQNRMQIVCLLVLVMSVWNFPVHAGNTGLQDVSAKCVGMVNLRYDRSG